MFTVYGSRRGLDCNGTSRRDFLKAGVLGPTGLLLSGLLRGRAAAPPERKINDTSVIWLWLSGGPSQLETFDPKPENPSEFRSVVGSVRTNVPGTHFGGLFPKLARHADKLAVVRSFTHKLAQADHMVASHQVMTGYDHPPAVNGAAQIKPSTGSILARYRGATSRQTGLPTFVKTDHLYADGPAWLGRAYSPFHVRDQAVADMTPRLTQDRLADRRTLLQSLDASHRRADETGLLEGLNSFEVQAFELLRNNASAAFDISREDQRTRDRYGPGLGQHLLLARRMCEAGVGFVNVWYGGWDSHGTNPAVNHGTIEQEMHKLAPSFDHSLSALLEDLYERGLNKKVLVVVTGEFGRSPGINKDGGRDHWPRLCPLVLAGGGMKMGQVIGKSSANADEPASTPIVPQDLMATLFQFLGMPLDLTYTDFSGRPTRMIDEGTPIAELI